MLINEPFPLLAGIHQALLTDPVNQSGNAGGSLLDYIHRNIRKKIFPAAGIKASSRRCERFVVPRNHDGCYLQTE